MIIIWFILIALTYLLLKRTPFCFIIICIIFWKVVHIVYHFCRLLSCAQRAQTLQWGSIMWNPVWRRAIWSGCQIGGRVNGMFKRHSVGRLTLPILPWTSQELMDHYTAMFHHWSTTPLQHIEQWSNRVSPFLTPVLLPYQQILSICITFVQRQPSVADVGLILCWSVIQIFSVCCQDFTSRRF